MGNRRKMVQQEPMRRFATAVHEDTDPSEESEGDSEDDVDEAMSIAPSDALSKMAGSSNTPTRKIQITPPLALRTRGKTRAPETKKPTSQATPRLSTSKPPSTQKGTTIKGKIPSLLERGRSSSPQPATQRPAPGPIRTSRPVGPAAHDSDVELSEFQTTEFRNLPYYKQLKLRIAHQNARHAQLLNQTLAQLVSSNQKNDTTTRVCHRAPRHFSKDDQKDWDDKARIHLSAHRNLPLNNKN